MSAKRQRRPRSCWLVPTSVWPWRKNQFQDTERKKMEAQVFQRSYCIPPNRNLRHNEPRNKHKTTAGMFCSNPRVLSSFINIFWWWPCFPGDLNACLFCLSGNPAWHQGVTPGPQRLVMKEKGGPSGTGSREDSESEGEVAASAAGGQQ